MAWIVFPQPFIINQIINLLSSEDASPYELEYLKEKVDYPFLASGRKEENSKSMRIPRLSVPNNIGAFYYFKKFMKDVAQYCVLFE